MNEVIQSVISTERKFTTSKELFDMLQDEAISNGFSLRIVRSDTQKQTMTIGCDRGGSIVSVASKRTTKTKKTGCKYVIYTRQISPGDWVVMERRNEHNHSLTQEPNGFSRARRFTEEQTKRLKIMQASGVTPKAQLAVLREEFPGCISVSRDVYNLAAKHRNQFLGNRTSIQALVDVLEENQCTSAHSQDSDGYIENFLFAHPESLKIVTNHYHVLLLDCTYKTNRYKMPLLVCTGLTPVYTSYFICGIFLKQETILSYTWALNRIKDILHKCADGLPSVIVTDNEAALLAAVNVVFPQAIHILCKWHINTNVMKNCKKQFDDTETFDKMMRDWNCLCAASTEEAFDNIWCQFLRDYEQSPQLTSYLANTWLPHKKHFVDAWVQQSTHFGCITTSRAESSNSFLKRFLSSSTGSLLTVVRETVLSIEHQVNEIRKKNSEDKCKRPVSCLDPLYDEVVYKISGYALTLVSHQVPTVMKPCTGKFARTMGLPCCHIICDRKQNNQRLLSLSVVA